MALALLYSLDVQTANEIKVNVRIEGPSQTIIHQSVNLPDQCLVTDSASQSHTYTGYRAVCALQTLQEQGLITYQVTDWGFALALDKINAIANATDWSQTWFLRHNNAAASAGIDGLILSANDELLLAYGPYPFPAPLKVVAEGNAGAIGNPLNLSAQIWSDAANQFTPYPSTVTFHINSTAYTSGDGKLVWSADGSPAINIRVEAPGTIRSAGLDLSGQNTASHVATRQVRNTFEAERGVKFLINYQADNGALDASAMVNDWAAIALSAQNYNSEAKNKIRSYLLTNPPTGETVTDSLRRAMALMALEIDPYDVNGVNYIQPVIDDWTDGYLGKKEFINEEIFALLVLRQAGFGRGEKMVGALLDQIMTAQAANGSWAESTDLTAAAIQALLTVRNLGNVETALERAEQYLRQQQTDYGGFDNSEFSTAWAIQAIAALGKSETDWYKNNLTPGEFLGGHQADDGGMSALLPRETRLWLTATVIPAALHKSWLALLAKFPKREVAEPPITPPAPVAEIISEETATTSSEIEIKEILEIEEIQEVIQPPVEEAAVENVALNARGIPTVIIDSTTTPELTTSTAIAPEITLTAAPTPLPESPLTTTARNLFRTATTLATTLGAYLAWRLLQTIV